MDASGGHCSWRSMQALTSRRSSSPARWATTPRRCPRTASGFAAGGGGVRLIILLGESDVQRLLIRCPRTHGVQVELLAISFWDLCGARTTRKSFGGPTLARSGTRPFAGSAVD